MDNKILFFISICPALLFIYAAGLGNLIVRDSYFSEGGGLCKYIVFALGSDFAAYKWIMSSRLD